MGNGKPVVRPLRPVLPVPCEPILLGYWCWMYISIPVSYISSERTSINLAGPRLWVRSEVPFIWWADTSSFHNLMSLGAAWSGFYGGGHLSASLTMNKSLWATLSIYDPLIAHVPSSWTGFCVTSRHSGPHGQDFTSVSLANHAGVCGFRVEQVKSTDGTCVPLSLFCLLDVHGQDFMSENISDPTMRHILSPCSSVSSLNTFGFT